MPPKPQTTVVVDDQVVVDPAVITACGPDELKEARRLLSWQRHGNQTVVRRRTHRAGATRIGSQVFVVPPDMPVRTFLGLVYTSYGLRSDQIAVAGMERAAPPELFRAALGASLVSAAEVVTRQHVHQAYERQVDRLQLIRGRPLWTQAMGRPRDGSVTCQYQLKTTDTLLNRLVLAGLLEARRLQPHGPLRRRAERQTFTWRGLAEPLGPVPRYQFESVRALLTRQTAHYNVALALSEALLYGTRAPGDEPTSSFDLPVYDLAVLFERLVEKLVTAAATAAGLTARLQHTRHDALLDAEENVYRRIRPDIVVYQGGQPVAVLDAKYKPRYTTGGPEPVAANRVSLADAYQLFFYAEHLRRVHGVQAPVPAYVVAPLLDDRDQVPRLPRRTVMWQQDQGDAPIGLRVIPLPLVEVVDIILNGESFAAAAMAAPELVRAITAAVPAVRDSNGFKGGEVQVT